MRELLPQREPDARRVGIDLPWMHHHDGGAAFLVDGIDHPAHPRRRAHAQAPSPPERHDLAKAVQHERRRLDDCRRGGLPQMRAARICRRADEFERRHAGVDGERFFAEHVEGPQRALADRPFGRPKHRHVSGAGGAQRLPAPKQVGAELAGSQLVHAPMVIPVGSELVSGRRDLLDELGMPLGQPADDEERGANAGAIEQIEQPPGRELHPRRQPVPVRERKRVDAADVEPFFHVNGEDVGHRRGRPGVRIGLGLVITSISRAAAR